MFLKFYKIDELRIVKIEPTTFKVSKYRSHFILNDILKLGFIETNNITDWDYSLISYILKKDLGR